MASTRLPYAWSWTGEGLITLINCPQLVISHQGREPGCYCHGDNVVPATKLNRPWLVVQRCYDEGTWETNPASTTASHSEATGCPLGQQCTMIKRPRCKQLRQKMVTPKPASESSENIALCDKQQCQWTHPQHPLACKLQVVAHIHTGISV